MSKFKILVSQPLCAKPAVVAALASLYLAGFAMTDTSHAKDIVCKGHNLFDELQKKEPQTAQFIRSEGEKLVYSKGLTWKITKGDAKPSYLFGTVHMSDPRLLDLPEKTRAAFEGADVLALEITDILDPAEMAKKSIGLMKYTTYLDGSSLSDAMTKEQIATTTKRFEKIGLPWSVVSRMKPWVAMGAIALPACELARKAAGKPFLDLSLGQEAQAAGKQIAALETLEGQMSAMAALSDKLMVDALVETARMEDQLEDMFETLIQLYKREEIGTILSLMRSMGAKGVKKQEEVEGFAAFQSTIIDQRNRTMAKAIGPLADKGGAFIAVGALHLPGEMGILNILAQSGYTVSRH